MKHFISTVLWVTIFIVMFQTCEETGVGSLNIIEVGAHDVNIEVDSTQQFTAVGRDVDMEVIPDLTFTWASSSPTVGTIDENGLFTGLSAGVTTITAKSGSIESNQVSMTVYDPVVSIEIQQSSLAIIIDSTVQFTAIGKDENGDDISGLSFSWESENTNIASITGDGIATGVSIGNTSVVAKLRELTSLPSIALVIEDPRGEMTDIDGNEYQTVKIGNQVWMAENLNVMHYRDGTEISHVPVDTNWAKTMSGAYCFYDNNSSNGDTYGALYNWYAVADSRNLAPEGWHVPTDAEWKELEMALGMSQSQADEKDFRGTNEGSKLAGNAALWTSTDKLKNDPEFGLSWFNALPASRRMGQDPYGYLGSFAYFWTTTEYDSYQAWNRSLSWAFTGIMRHDQNDKRDGFSVRCLQD